MYHSINNRSSAATSFATQATCTVAVVGVFLLGTGSVYPFERAGQWADRIQPRLPFALDIPRETEALARLDLRTAAAHLGNIRAVLGPTVTELAAIFDVSRQAVYKWLAGDSTPESDKHAKIAEVSRIADMLRDAGIVRAASLLKMKAFEGRSLLELLASGENLPAHVDALIREARTMEESYRASALSSSRAQPTNDWQASVSVPGSIERTGEG